MNSQPPVSNCTVQYILPCHEISPRMKALHVLLVGDLLCLVRLRLSPASWMATTDPLALWPLLLKSRRGVTSVRSVHRIGAEMLLTSDAARRTSIS